MLNDFLRWGGSPNVLDSRVHPPEVTFHDIPPSKVTLSGQPTSFMRVHRQRVPSSKPDFQM
jgi:hypothetical protein